MEGKQTWARLELPSPCSGAAAEVTVPVARGSAPPRAHYQLGTADFSPGDSEVITGLWWAPPAHPPSGGGGFVGLFSQRRQGAHQGRTLQVPPRHLLPPQPSPLLAEGRQEREVTRSLLFSAEHDFGRRFCTSKVPLLFVTYFPSLTLRPPPTGKASVALNRSVRGET